MTKGHLTHKYCNVQTNTALNNIAMFCSMFDVSSGQGQDVGVLCHTTPDELCEQVYKESEAV